MKTEAYILGLLLVLPLTARCQFAGGDSFSSSTKNTARWSEDTAQGGAALTQPGNGTVLYTSDSDDTSSDFWTWKGLAPVTNSWTAQMDVNAPTFTLGEDGSNAGIGLIVFKGTSTDSSMTAALQQNEVTGSQQLQFDSMFTGDGEPADVNVTAPNTTGSVRIHWDAPSHTLSAEYDADGPANGYSWTAVRSFDPTLNSTWEIESNDVFTVGIIGYSEGTFVDVTNTVTGANFITALSGTVASPTLTVSAAGGQVTLSWPLSAGAYSLQSNSAVNNPGGWSGVGVLPSTNGNVISVTLPMSGSQQFFRLAQ